MRRLGDILLAIVIGICLIPFAAALKGADLEDSYEY